MKFIIPSLILSFFLTGCMNESKVKKMLEDNPDILISSIKKNPTKFLEALQEAAQSAKAEMAKKREEDE